MMRKRSNFGLTRRAPLDCVDIAMTIVPVQLLPVTISSSLCSKLIGVQSSSSIPELQSRRPKSVGAVSPVGSSPAMTFLMSSAVISRFSITLICSPMPRSMWTVISEPIAFSISSSRLFSRAFLSSASTFSLASLSSLSIFSRASLSSLSIFSRASLSSRSIFSRASLCILSISSSLSRSSLSSASIFSRSIRSSSSFFFRSSSSFRLCSLSSASFARSSSSLALSSCIFIHASYLFRFHSSCLFMPSSALAFISATGFRPLLIRASSSAFQRAAAAPDFTSSRMRPRIFSTAAATPGSLFKVCAVELAFACISLSCVALRKAASKSSSWSSFISLQATPTPSFSTHRPCTGWS
mmetsp:Transcript_2584/g.6294  ORF Transcript_2584/g.6294 Transcript_2584/m.6294 type:complete len:354 (-) Transcript_2584:37-1098(-)